MKTEVFCVYDSKAKTYSQPFHAHNEAVAVRIFTEAVNDPATQLNRHSEDFVLFKTARFDDETGSFEPQVAQAICTAIAVKEASKNGTN